MEFHDSAIFVFVRNLRKLVQPAQNNEVCSEEHVRMLTHIIDMLVTLDALKDMKACLQNDFARYKRSFANIRNDIEDSDTIADNVHNLQMFLGNPQQPHDLILSSLRSEVQKVPGFEDALLMLIEHCLDSLDRSVYLLASEKNMLLRVLINLVFLLDSNDKKATNAFKCRKLNIERVRTAFKNRPVLPLYGDMNMSIEFVLKRCPNFDAIKMSNWFKLEDPSVYLLSTHQKRIHAEYNEFSARFLQVWSFDSDHNRRRDRDHDCSGAERGESARARPR